MDHAAIRPARWRLYVDYAQNIAADVNAITGNKEDTAYSLGFLYGKASDPRTWEIGYFYQSIEKDALFGQYIDSDWGAGNTDASGSVIKFGYAFAKNFTLQRLVPLCNDQRGRACDGSRVLAPSTIATTSACSWT